VGIKVVDEKDDIMLITKNGIVIRLNVSEVSRMGRITQGVTLMKFDKDQTLVSIAKIEADDN
jgi:DNA gyrase subunit A